MKKTILIFFLFACPFHLYSQQKSKKNNIICTVVCTTDKEIPGKVETGGGAVMGGKKLYVYNLEDADVFLLSGTDTLARAKSDFEGIALFQKISDGEYKVAVKKGKYVGKARNVKVQEKPATVTAYIDMF